MIHFCKAILKNLYKHKSSAPCYKLRPVSALHTLTRQTLTDDVNPFTCQFWQQEAWSGYFWEWYYLFIIYLIFWNLNLYFLQCLHLNKTPTPLEFNELRLSILVTIYASEHLMCLDVYKSYGGGKKSESILNSEKILKDDSSYNIDLKLCDNKHCRPKWNSVTGLCWTGPSTVPWSLGLRET